MYHRKILYLLSSISSLTRTCQAAAIIAITSPKSNITPGSTISVTWVNNATYINSLDIQLIKFIDSGSTVVVARLATTDVNDNTKSYSVKLPSNLSTASIYAITLSQKGTQLASSGPLQILQVSSSGTEALISNTATNGSKKTSDDNSALDVITPTVVRVESTSPSPTSLVFIVSSSTPSSITNTSQITSNNDYESIGPTLTSGQVACIAMSIVACAGVVSIIYFFGKWINEQRKSYRRRHKLWDESSSNHNSTINNESSVSNNNKKKRRVFTLENINEEYIRYDNQYYDQYNTATDRNLTYNSLTPATKNNSRPSSPFGQPPETFNGNRYVISNNDFPINIPPPPNAYAHNQ